MLNYGEEYRKQCLPWGSSRKADVKLVYLAALVVSCFCFFACVNLEEKPLLVEIDPAEMNQTSYVFPKSEQDVLNAIVDAFGGGKSSRWPKSSSTTYEDYFLSTGSTAGIFKLTPAYGNLSKVYFRENGEPYLYRPTIQIFTNAINDNETRVDINVIEPCVRTRLTLLPLPPHFQKAWKSKPVPATTVEEYEILRMLGNELSIKNMPEIKIPPQ
jgi:hypothetical protein